VRTARRRLYLALERLRTVVIAASLLPRRLPTNEDTGYSSALSRERHQVSTTAERVSASYRVRTLEISAMRLSTDLNFRRPPVHHKTMPPRPTHGRITIKRFCDVQHALETTGCVRPNLGLDVDGLRHLRRPTQTTSAVRRQRNVFMSTISPPFRFIRSPADRHHRFPTD